MWKIRRIISIAAAAALILSMLAACDTENSNNKIGTADSQGTQGNNKKQGPSWTWDTTPVKLDWYINFGWYDKKWDAQNCLYDKTVTEKTGVDLNIIVPSGGSDEKLTTMVASDDLPDIMTIDNWNTIRELMIKAGKFQPLNKLAEEYAPDLLGVVPESMKKWHIREDGNWYAISNYFTAPEWLTKESYIENNNGIIARKDIMDQLGIKPEDFSTQDGTVAAFKKVKDAKLTFEGREVIPFFSSLSEWVMARMWGIPWETPDGNWQDIRLHPKYLEMYKFLNRLWQEGLISRDNFTGWAGEKISQGIAFSYMGNIDDVKSSISDIYKRDSRAVYVPVGPVHALDGAQPSFDQAGTGWTSTFITRKSRKPDRAIRLLAFLAGDEGQMLTWYGIKGKTYDLVNGKARFTEEYQKLVDNDLLAAHTLYGVGTFWPLQQHLFNQKLVDHEAMSQDEKNYLVIKKFYSQFAVITPETMGVNPGPDTGEAGINVKIDEYWSGQVTKMIMAVSGEEVERIYRESVKQIYNLGYQKVYNETNANFKAQKKKFGKQFSYPGNMK